MSQPQTQVYSPGPLPNIASIIGRWVHSTQLATMPFQTDADSRGCRCFVAGEGLLLSWKCRRRPTEGTSSHPARLLVCSAGCLEHHDPTHACHSAMSKTHCPGDATNLQLPCQHMSATVQMGADATCSITASGMQQCVLLVCTWPILTNSQFS